MKAPKFAIKTLGCKVNQYEGQLLRESLAGSGFQESGPLDADVGIINSCTVTAKADLKTRKLIKRFKKDNPSAKIFVTGCYAVLEEDIKALEAMPEIYRIVPNKEKMSLPSVIGLIYDRMIDSRKIKEQVRGFDSHTRAFLKVQDGCDSRCSYCKVNIVRGPSRSKEKKKVIEELKSLAGSGYKEIVLTGICLGSWKDNNGKKFSDLLKEIEEIKGDFRLRLSSIEPEYIDDDLIKVMADSTRICRHFHLPLQSGSDEVLKLMDRSYDSSRFQGLVEKIRNRMPYAGITMDVISGFPGETGKDFEQTMAFLQEVKPSRMHVFGYSDRKGTSSFKMKDKVHPDIIKSRVDKLIGIGEKFQADFCRKFLGKDVEVLVEKEEKDLTLLGYTEEYAKAKLMGFSGNEGSLIWAKATQVDQNLPCLVIENRDFEGIKPRS